MKKSILVFKNDRSKIDVNKSFERFLNGESKPVDLEEILNDRPIVVSKLYSKRS